MISLDDALQRIAEPGERPFVVLTFDDGFCDNVEHALPVLEKHAAPFTMFATSGFADRTARLWWIELEEAIRRLDQVGIDGFAFPTASAAQKAQAYAILYRTLRSGPEERLLQVCAELCAQAGLDPLAIPADLCLDWAGLQRLSEHKLATIGVHTLTHPMLAKHPRLSCGANSPKAARVSNRPSAGPPGTSPIPSAIRPPPDRANLRSLATSALPARSRPGRA